jgi:DMSO/TMAO reductase YedYZ molybdopterin-dependent catalytic subunit
MDDRRPIEGRTPGTNPEPRRDPPPGGAPPAPRIDPPAPDTSPAPRIDPPAPETPPAPVIEPPEPGLPQTPAIDPPPNPTPPPPPRRADAARASAGSGSIEPPETIVEVPRRRLAAQSRRDFLLFAAGTIASALGAWWLLPDTTKRRMTPGSHGGLDSLAARVGLSRGNRERVLDRALTFDDDVAEALYSPDRRVRTYARADVTPLRNNYLGATPGAGILEGWTLRLAGLAGGGTVALTLDQLLARFAHREQVTRLVCVEGWSAVAWWGGIRFADLLAAFPPAPGARWAAMVSSVSLDPRGRPEPYYVSIDLGTARHPQTLLATHQDGRPLTLAHGAPLRLLVPVKLGLKNIKAITDITYTATEPADYWNERGYSKYDGL